MSFYIVQCLCRGTQYDYSRPMAMLLAFAFPRIWGILLVSRHEGEEGKEVVQVNTEHCPPNDIMNIHIAWRCEILDGLELISGEVSSRKLQFNFWPFLTFHKRNNIWPDEVWLNCLIIRGAFIQKEGGTSILVKHRRISGFSLEKASQSFIHNTMVLAGHLIPGETGFWME